MSIRSQNKHVNLQTQIQDLSLSYKLLGCQFILEIPSFLIEIEFTDYEIHHFKPCNLVGVFWYVQSSPITPDQFSPQTETPDSLAVPLSPTYPSSRQPLIYFTNTKSICFVQRLHLDGTTHQVAFCVQLLSLSMFSGSFILEHGSTLCSFFMAE